MSTYKRLSEVYENPFLETIPYDCTSKFVIMSDCHRGSGYSGDNFLKKSYLFDAALNEYYKKGFTYIELGDGDELWENRCMKKIDEIHKGTFNIMSKFYNEHRLYMIFGNHDKEKEHDERFKCDSSGYYSKCHSSECCSKRNLRKYCYKYDLRKYCSKCDSSEYCNEGNSTNNPIFQGLKVHEGLVLENINNENHRIFLVHGHQGDLLNDKFYKVGRFLVRYFWKNLERWGVNDPTGAGKNYRKKKRIEHKLANWSHKEKIMLIAGHTHRPSFPNVGERMYFNDGSCVHPECITAIEIKNGCISLVRWYVTVKEDGSMCVKKSEPPIRGPKKLEDYFERAPEKPEKLEGYFKRALKKFKKPKKLEGYFEDNKKDTEKVTE